MPTVRRPLLPAAAACALVLLLAGCGGQRDATRDGVRDRLEGAGFSSQAASCVADGMFSDSATWSKEERNAATRAPDGDAANPALEAKLVALFEECGIDEGIERQGEGDDGGEGEADGDDETTTTEADAADVTTTEGDG